MDIVGVITSYTGKLKRRGDSFVNQIDVQSPALARGRELMAFWAARGDFD